MTICMEKRNVESLELKNINFKLMIAVRVSLQFPVSRETNLNLQPALLNINSVTAIACEHVPCQFLGK